MTDKLAKIAENDGLMASISRFIRDSLHKVACLRSLGGAIDYSDLLESRKNLLRSICIVLSKQLITDGLSEVISIIPIDHETLLFIDKNQRGSLKCFKVEFVVLFGKSVIEDPSADWIKMRSDDFYQQFVCENENLDQMGRDFIFGVLKNGPAFACNGSYVTIGVYQNLTEIIIQQVSLTSDKNGRTELEWHYPINGSEAYMVIGHLADPSLMREGASPYRSSGVQLFNPLVIQGEVTTPCSQIESGDDFF